MKLTDIFKRHNNNVEERSATFQDILNSSLLFSSYSGLPNNKSMQLATVSRCVNLISDSLASLPIIDKGGVQPFNVAYMTKFNLIKSMAMDMLLQGNAFALIDNGKLLYVPASAVNSYKIDKNNEQIIYNITGIGAVGSNILIHIINIPDSTGYWGISTISNAANSLQGLHFSEETSKTIMKSGGCIKGIITSTTALTAAQKKQIKDTWQQSVNSDGNGIPILEGNLGYQQVSVSPSDLALLDSRKFDSVQICKFFNVSPIMAFDEVGTYNSSEQAMLNFLQNCLSPIIVKFEEEFSRKLNQPINFNEDVLLRCSKSEQAQYLNSLLINGIISINEARERLGLLPSNEKGANELSRQMQMQPISYSINNNNNNNNE